MPSQLLSSSRKISHSGKRRRLKMQLKICER
jgi:hypothetical protein